ncbi:MAG: LysR family transcriptional regulator [bacterium]|nr:LysR family transcriptional regulator [bacterium]
MSFTLHQLRVFSEVARHKSITRASEALFMSQPAVSIQVKKLQDHFGVDLFEVIGRQLYLTEAGKELEKVQNRIEQEFAGLEMYFSELKGSLTGTLNLSVVSTAKYFMPYILGEFKKQYPEINVSLKVTDRSEVIDDLTNNKCDLALFSILPDDLELISTEVVDNPLYMVAPADHHLMGKSIKLDELKEEGFILRESNSGTRLVLEKLLADAGIEPKVVMKLSTNEAVKQAIMAGIGISLVTEHSILLEKRLNKLCVLNVQELPYVNKWKLVHLKGKRLSPVAKNFLHFTTTSDIESLLPLA